METKRQEEIKKLMQMPEETIANLSESEADQYGRQGMKAIGKKQNRSVPDRKSCRRMYVQCRFSWSMKQSVGKRSAITRSLNGWKRKPKKDLRMQGKETLI